MSSTYQLDAARLAEVAALLSSNTDRSADLQFDVSHATISRIARGIWRTEVSL